MTEPDVNEEIETEKKRNWKWLASLTFHWWMFHFRVWYFYESTGGWSLDLINPFISISDHYHTFTFIELKFNGYGDGTEVSFCKMGD